MINFQTSECFRALFFCLFLSDAETHVNDAMHDDETQQAHPTTLITNNCLNFNHSFANKIFGADYCL